MNHPKLYLNTDASNYLAVRLYFSQDMRGFVARVLSTLIGGLVGFIVSSFIYLNYSNLFSELQKNIAELAKFIPAQFRVQEVEELEQSWKLLHFYVNVILASGFFIGYIFTPAVDFLLIRLTTFLASVAKRTSRQRFIITAQGVFAGILLSALIINVPLFYYLTNLPGSIFSHPFVMSILHTLVLITFGYAGGFLATVVFFPPTGRESILAKYEIEQKPRILDTSVLIDGRIVEILKTGFIPGLLIVPKSVVHELQLVADSSDQLKRNKGRRGLEILKNLEASVPNPVHFYDDSHLDTTRMSVDDVLIEIASELGAEVITNDYNLNRVAAIRKVPVLNINELANAVKPMLIPGETLNVSIVKPGKESGQGVGYLEDGTMVVVESGEDYIGSICEVDVTSIMQTIAGRLIFSKVKRVLGGNEKDVG